MENKKAIKDGFPEFLNFETMMKNRKIDKDGYWNILDFKLARRESEVGTVKDGYIYLAEDQ